MLSVPSAQSSREDITGQQLEVINLVFFSGVLAVMDFRRFFSLLMVFPKNHIHKNDGGILCKNFNLDYGAFNFHKLNHCCLYLVLEIESNTLHMLGKNSITELHYQSELCLLMLGVTIQIESDSEATFMEKCIQQWKVIKDDTVQWFSFFTTP